MIDDNSLIKKIPGPIRAILNPIASKIIITVIDKKMAELNYWRRKYKLANGVFSNSHYQQLMLAMAEEPNDNFMRGKIVADFGCGPRGSLAWIKSTNLRIGIDVLADKYVDEFTENIISHEMIYLKSTEKSIPLPSNFVDVMFTLNAIDHVDSFTVMCSEIIRVLKPGGDFIGSFNLEEPSTKCEPQKLDEKIIEEHLLNKLEVISYRITEQRTDEERYAAFFNGNLSYDKGQKGYLWVRAKKRIS